MLKLMPNELPGTALAMEHRLPLPACCPVSGNPRAGSTITIRYQMGKGALEVYALKAYVEEFVGGRGEIRTMEGMIQRIAQDAAETVGTHVYVLADLQIEPGQEMRLTVHAWPKGG